MAGNARMEGRRQLLVMHSCTLFHIPFTVLALLFNSRNYCCAVLPRLALHFNCSCVCHTAVVVLRNVAVSRRYVGDLLFYESLKCLMTDQDEQWVKLDGYTDNTHPLIPASQAHCPSSPVHSLPDRLSRVFFSSLHLSVSSTRATSPPHLLQA